MAASGFDDSELRVFASDLTRSAASIAPKVRAVVVKGGVNIKNQLRNEMQSSFWFKGVARSISFDVVAEADSVEAQVGPETGPGSPGNLANIAIFGSSRGGGTVPDPQGALDVEAPRFEKALGDVLQGIL